MGDEQNSQPQPTAAQIESELVAFNAVGAALIPLSPDARERVIRWAMQYFRIGRDQFGGY